MSDPERFPRLSSDSFSATLRRFVADAQVDEAAAARSREHWLRQQLAESSSFVSALTSAAEAQATVGLALAASDMLRCTISLVGADFVLASSDAGAEHLIALDAINRIETDSLRSSSNERRPASAVEFWEAAAALAEDRPEVAVHHLDGSATSGELLGVTADELRLRVRPTQSAQPARAISVRLGSVARLSSRSWH